MDKRAQMQFRFMAPDAQRSAIRRLALSGLEDEEIAQATGLGLAEIRNVLAPPMIPEGMPWAPQRSGRSGSSGNGLRG
jgi:hypothetical protein